jgi:hypothetical protein
VKLLKVITARLVKLNTDVPFVEVKMRVVSFPFKFSDVSKIINSPVSINVPELK